MRRKRKKTRTSATPHQAVVFQRFLRRALPYLEERLGQERAAAVAAAPPVEYLRIVPRIPDIGGRRNVFTPVMVVNGWIIALHRALVGQGGSAEDTVRVCAAVADGFLRAVPGPLLRTLGRLALTGPVRRHLARQAARSQERQYAADFVWRVEEGPGGETSLVFDECAVNKFYEAEGVEELKAYCSFFDVTYSRLMGMGIDANETIGIGCQRCRLSYRRGRETRIPPQLEGVLPG